MSMDANEKPGYDGLTDHDLRAIISCLTTEEKEQLITLVTMLIEAQTTGTYEAARLYAESVLMEARERRGDTPEEAMDFVAEHMRRWERQLDSPGKEAVS